MINKLSRLFIPLLTIIFLTFTPGCGDQRTDSPDSESEMPEQINGNTDTTEMRDTTQLEKETTEKIPDIKGTWSGKLDAHNSTLRITEQDGLNFKGSISTNFRETVNQEVSGEFNPENNTIKMRDIHKTRNMGTYTAKLSEDMKSMTGTFTLTHDKTNFSFNYKKQ